MENDGMGVGSDLKLMGNVHSEKGLAQTICRCYSLTDVFFIGSGATAMTLVCD